MSLDRKRYIALFAHLLPCISLYMLLQAVVSPNTPHTMPRTVAYMDPYFRHRFYM
jgi:hypothetical protein